MPATRLGSEGRSEKDKQKKLGNLTAVYSLLQFTNRYKLTDAYIIRLPRPMCQQKLSKRQNETSDRAKYLQPPSLRSNF